MSAGEGNRPRGYGPEQRRAAIAITFDNLGEASDLERGRWPSDEPLGRHRSVTRSLPRVLELLAEHGLAATFFIEGVNAELYPDALSTVDAGGHEIAYHGWRHERWAELDPAAERELLERGMAALDALGLRPIGFRPPGGTLAASSPSTLAELGFSYCSPAGDGLALREDLAVLPFRWPLIDAFHYLPHFAQRRQNVLGSPDPLRPVELRQALGRAVQQADVRRGFIALLFHPFPADTEERVSALRSVLGQVRAAVDDGGVWCAPMRDIADWVRDQPQAHRWDLRLDLS